MESPIRPVVVETLGNEASPVVDDVQSRRSRRNTSSQRRGKEALEVDDADWFKLYWDKKRKDYFGDDEAVIT